MTLYSEHEQYYRFHNIRARNGEFCRGDDCPVWFLSEVDTWHECPCNKKKKVPHPEDDQH